MEVLEVVKTDPISDKFRTYLNDVLTNPKEQRRLKAELFYYISDCFETFTPEQIKDLCNKKSERGAIEHGPKLITDPIAVQREKLDELLDLVVYTVIQEYQRKGS